MLFALCCIAIDACVIRNSMIVSSSGSLGSFMTGMLSGLTRGLADWKPSQCNVICLVVFGGITPDELRCMKQYGSKLGEQTLVVVSNSLTSRNTLYEAFQKDGVNFERYFSLFTWDNQSRNVFLKNNFSCIFVQYFCINIQRIISEAFWFKCFV